MTNVQTDIAILGSGFAGSLTALILNRIGLRPVVLDRAAHPRFAIGESSTPVANYVLRSLAEKYDLLRLVPLCKYGEWQRHYPQVVAGLKRGFSYFHHAPGEPFQPRADHANELLVAASHDDEHSDTHWLRADVDAFLADEVRRADVPLFENTSIRELAADETGDGWIIRGERGGERGGEAVDVRAAFVIDATGEGSVVPRSLGISTDPSSLHTRSRAIYSHFRGLRGFHDILAERGAVVADHPFCCDDAAQHQIVDGAWMWVLRFNNGVTSAGFAIDESRWPLDESLSPETEWQSWLDKYPSVAELFRDATIVDPPGRIVRTRRLQRRAARAVGRNWGLLPHTAGFIDPLHSSGIAHTLCGIERLTHAIECHWRRDGFENALAEYERAVFLELELIDKLVAGCYAAFGDFRKLVAYSMLYFAATTTYEHRRAERGFEPSQLYLRADDVAFQAIVEEFFRRVTSERLSSQPLSSDNFERDLAAALRPYNIAGLCNPAAQNMYRYTAAPHGD